MPVLTRVKPLDNKQFGATAYNAIVDSRLDLNSRFCMKSSPKLPRLSSGIVFVQNMTGADRERWDIVGIDAPIFTRADYPNTFGAPIMLNGCIPTEGLAGKFAILTEPIADGFVGRALMSGIICARVQMTTEDDTTADSLPDDPTMLKSGSGMAQLLWVEPEEQREPHGDPPKTDIAMCIVRLGGGGGVAAAANAYVDTANESDLTCRHIGADQQPIGVIPDDQFIVKVLGAYGSTGNYVETCILANCAPKFPEGTVIPVYWDATYEAWYFDGLVIDMGCT